MKTYFTMTISNICLCNKVVKMDHKKQFHIEYIHGMESKSIYWWLNFMLFSSKNVLRKKVCVHYMIMKKCIAFLDNFTIICDQIIFRDFFMYIWEVKCMGWPYLGAMDFIWYYDPSWNWSPVQMYYKFYNLQSTLVALASAHWSYGFEFHYHTKDLGKWFLWIYRRRRQSTKRNRFFLSNFKTSMKAPANSSTLQIKPSDYGLSMNENGNLRLFWSKIMIQLVAYTFECYYWTHFISQIIQKWVSHTETYGYKFNSHFLWKKNYYPVLMRENGNIKQDKRIEITKKRTESRVLWMRPLNFPIMSMI